MKSIFRSGISILLLLLSMVIYADNPVIVYAAIDAAPLAYTDKGQHHGILVDIARAAVKKMGYRLEIKIYPPKRVPISVGQGNADFLFLFHPKGEANLDFSNKFEVSHTPLLSLKCSGFALKDRNLRVNSLTDLYQYRIGHLAQLASIEASAVPGLKDRMRVVRSDLLIKALYGKRIDIALMGDALFFHHTKAMGLKSQSEIVYKFAPFSLSHAWSKDSLTEIDSELPIEFSKAIREMKHEGKLEDIINNYSNTEYFTDFGVTHKKVSNSTHLY